MIRTSSSGTLLPGAAKCSKRATDGSLDLQKVQASDLNGLREMNLPAVTDDGCERGIQNVSKVVRLGHSYANRFPLQTGRELVVITVICVKQLIRLSNVSRAS